jgi:predicted nuclease of predicted toxin-antitoxin system
VSAVLPPLKFLLDEDISPVVANRLQERGIDATHVRNRGMLGATDREVLDLAFKEDRILITANVADFEHLAASIDIHAGIILLLNGSLRRVEQLHVIEQAIDALISSKKEMVNRAMSISRDGTYSFIDLPYTAGH